MTPTKQTRTPRQARKYRYHVVMTISDHTGGGSSRHVVSWTNSIEEALHDQAAAESLGPAATIVDTSNGREYTIKQRGEARDMHSRPGTSPDHP